MFGVLGAEYRPHVLRLLQNIATDGALQSQQSNEGRWH